MIMKTQVTHISHHFSGFFDDALCQVMGACESFLYGKEPETVNGATYGRNGQPGGSEDLRVLHRGPPGFSDKAIWGMIPGLVNWCIIFLRWE